MASYEQRLSALPRDDLIKIILRLSQSVSSLKTQLLLSQNEQQKLSDQLFATRQQWKELQNAVQSVSLMMQTNRHTPPSKAFAFDKTISEALNVVAEQELRELSLASSDALFDSDTQDENEDEYEEHDQENSENEDAGEIFNHENQGDKLLDRENNVRTHKQDDLKQENRREENFDQTPLCKFQNMQNEMDKFEAPSKAQ